MKRFSPIFFIWLSNFILSSIVLFFTYNSGTWSETLAWSVSTIFTLNILLYHLWVTKGEKSKKIHSDIIDE